ncbi:T9SS type B sorting domain-containing protein [Bizionia sp. KMM 8389]
MKQTLIFPYLIAALFISSFNFALTPNVDTIPEIVSNTPCPAPVLSSFSPQSGPENTMITITGSNFSDTATVLIDGISASFNIISDTELTVYSPSGTSDSASISVTSNGGCTGNSSTNFNVLQSNCSVGDIYISEIYDAISGSYAVIELFNPTNTAINLDGVYIIDRYGDIGNAAPSHTYAMLGTIAPLDTFIILLGSGSDCPSLVSDFTVGTGINDNDEFKLLKNGTLIDIVNAPAERGYTIIRNADAPIPQTTYDINDWSIYSQEDCSDLDSHTADPIVNNTPTITQPADQSICENGTATFSVSVSSGTFNYQWKTLNASGVWVDVVNNATYSDATTNTLLINNAPVSFNNNQYYCEITSASCNLVSDASHLFVSNPNVDSLSNQEVCTEYILPVLTDGYYFTQTNGAGTQLNAGQAITTNQTIYIYNEIGTAPSTCSNESSFTVTVLGTPPVDTLPNYTDCSSYTLPVLTDGNYFTGPNGTGTPLNANEVISTSQTIYIYNEIGTAPNNCSNESSFTVTISGTPPVDTITNQEVCTEYILPVLTDGNYFTQTNGAGTQLNAGQAITTNQTIYIYNEIGTAPNTCSNESSFTVTVLGTPPVDTLPNYTDCSSYTLPALTDGNYFTGPNGTGTPLNANEIISTSQTIYIYNEIGTAPNNCSNESSFTVTISGTPPVDTIANQDVCTDYILPTLTNGSYYTGPNQTGSMLNAGQVITTDQTIYIYNETGVAPNICSNESSFTVTIVGTPPVDTLGNSTDCSAYILPSLTNGSYFTGSNGTGTQLNAGTSITTSQTIYIYNEIGTAPNNCFNESSFTVTILGEPAVDVLSNESSCSEFVLPALTNGDYYTETNGGGTQLFAGDSITNDDVIYIFATNGSCSSESQFTVTIYPATDFTLTEDNLNINDNTLQVIMTDTSISYEYAVDSGSFQTSPQFTGLSSGTHTLYVQDLNGCVIKTIDFEIEMVESIHIPLFFTPNNDGQNDVWKITDPENTIKEIFVFDRYGKLLKQLPLQSKSWDGLYRGYLKETNDYWYLINLRNGEQLNGHFTLKR